MLKTNKLQSKIIITFFLLLLYRLVTYIPLPGISFTNIVNQSTKGIIQIIYTFTGLNFSHASILSLGIMPYISSSIFLQFINFAFPFDYLMTRKINLITRWFTIGICLLQAPIYLIAMTTKFLPFFYMPKAYNLDISNYNFFFICIVLLTIGSLFCLWIGEKITNKGIYNGISFIIMTAIIARFPENIVMEVSNSLELGKIGFFLLFLESVILLIIIYYTLYIIQIVCKIPIQFVNYIKNNNTINNRYIPLKILASGVLPIIFSETIILLTTSLVTYLNNKKLKIFFENVYGIWYNCIFIILIIIFTFFYRSIAIPSKKIGYDLKKNEAYIPKTKPGIETINLISEISHKITFPGALLLVIIATFPTLLIKIGINRNLSLFYGGTSLLIIISGILETLQHIYIMTYYEK